MQSDELVIQRSKGKTAASALGSLAFVAIGVWMVSGGIPKLGGRAVFIGVLALAVFGPFLLLHLRALFDRSPGMIIGRVGFVDASSAVSAGMVRWDDIAELSITTISSQRMLTVRVHDPAPYLARGNFFQRRIHKMNSKLTGSSINLVSNGLKISFDELVAAIEDGLARSRGQLRDQAAPATSSAS